MFTESISCCCDWCEEQALFGWDGDVSPDDKWRTSGWMIHLTDEGEKEYCSVECCISAMAS